MVRCFLKEWTSQLTTVLSHSLWVTVSLPHQVTLSLPYFFLNCSYTLDHSCKFQLCNPLLSLLPLGHTWPSLCLQVCIWAALSLALFPGFCHFQLLCALPVLASVLLNPASSQPVPVTIALIQWEVGSGWEETKEEQRGGLSLNFPIRDSVSLKTFSF